MATTGLADTERAMPPPTPSERFFNYFQHEVTDLQDQMSRLESRGTSGGERADAVDHCLAGIARLSDEVHDAAAYLPAYDQRTYGEAIRALTAKLQTVRASFAPRPRFAFRQGPKFQAKKNASAISLADAEAETVPVQEEGVEDEESFPQTPDEDEDGGVELDGSSTRSLLPSSTIPVFSQPDASSLILSGHDGLHIIRPPAASQYTPAHTGSLSLLHRCVIDLSGPFTTASRSTSIPAMASISIKDTRESLILCGRVAASTHLTRLTRCVVVVATGQFRMHESRDCDVYLHTTGGSRPVIENCTGIRFAPLPDAYALPGEQDAGDEEEGGWNQVEDFQWLRGPNDPSPNWKVLPQEERIADEVWRDVVPGRPTLSTNDVLGAVGLPP